MVIYLFKMNHFLIFVLNHDFSVYFALFLLHNISIIMHAKLYASRV